MRHLAFVAVFALALGRIVHAQPCAPAWDNGFNSPTTSEYGVNGSVRAVAVRVTQNGTRPVFGGQFTHASGESVGCIVEWDNGNWLSFAGGVANSPQQASISSIVFFDEDGDGPGEPAMFVGGSFSSAGGLPASNVAKWNGTAWSALGSGVAGFVSSLAVFDTDGNGPQPAALYVGGAFQSAGGVAASNIARWDGTTWSPLAAGLDTSVSALCVFDQDDQGPSPAELYACGTFQNVGPFFAHWNGNSWFGVPGLNFPAIAMIIHDVDGPGPAIPQLALGGGFTLAGPSAASGLALWNGSTLQGIISNAVFASVTSLASFDLDGVGPASRSLYAGGTFNPGANAYYLGQWNGSQWLPLGGAQGPNAVVNALAVADAGIDGEGQAALIVGGNFSTSGGVAANFAASYRLGAWLPFFSGHGLDGSVNMFWPTQYASTRSMVVAGSFSKTGRRIARGVAEWLGEEWAFLDGALPQSQPLSNVKTAVVFDDGTGEAVYVGGQFSQIGGVSANNVAKWNGTTWSPLGSGTNIPVNALAVYDDDDGPALYAACDFFIAGGVPVNRIARWNGTIWTPLGELGAGLGGAVVNALAVFDDGGGPALFVGGAFTSAGGNPNIQRIAKWNGSVWSGLTSGVNGTVTALDVLSDHTGPALYVRGSFTTANGQPAKGIAKWQNQQWNTMGGGVVGFGEIRDLAVYAQPGGIAYLYATGSFTQIGNGGFNNIAWWSDPSWTSLGPLGLNAPGNALTVFDDGTGPALYVGGAFTEVDGLAARHIAQWDGDWHVLWTGTDSGTVTAVNDLAVFDEDGPGPIPASLYAGGDFTTAGSIPSYNIARWNGCSSPPAPLLGDIDCNGTIDIDDVIPFVNVLVGLDQNPEHVARADINADGSRDGLDVAPMVHLLLDS